MKKRLIISLILCFVTIPGIIFYNIYKAKPLFDKVRGKTTTSTFLLEAQIFEPEYAHLFKPEALAKIQVLVTTKNTNRNTFQSYRYDDQFELYITKLNTQNTSSLDEFLNIDSKSKVRPSRDVVYSEKDGKTLLLSLPETAENKQVSRVFLSIEKASGIEFPTESKRYTQNLIGYNLPVKALSLQYNDTNAPVDIYFNAYEVYSTHEGLVDLLLYKKGQDIYVLLMYPNRKSAEFPKELLKSLLK